MQLQSLSFSFELQCLSLGWGDQQARLTPKQDLSHRQAHADSHQQGQAGVNANSKDIQNLPKFSRTSAVSLEGYSSPGEDPAFASVELHMVPPQPLEVLLKGCTAPWGLGHCSQLCVPSRLAEGASVPLHIRNQYCRKHGNENLSSGSMEHKHHPTERREQEWSVWKERLSTKCSKEERRVEMKHFPSIAHQQKPSSFSVHFIY